MKKNIADNIEQKLHKIMRQEMEIPESVNIKIDETIQKIKSDNQNQITSVVKKERHWKRNVAAAAACILALSGITVTAATLSGWNQDLAKRFQADERKQKMLSDKKVTAPVDAQAENGGYCIKLEQALCSDHYMYLWFTITAPEGETISNDLGFSGVSLLADGEDIAGDKFRGSYDSGIPDGESQEDWNSNSIHYEFWIQLDDEGESLAGKTMTARFQDMYFGSTQDEGNIVQGPAGTWDVSWKLEYESSEKEFQVDQKLDQENITVKKVILSPISIAVEYEWERVKEAITVIDEDGTERIREQYKDPEIGPAALKLKDGTVENLDTSGAGSSGYVSGDETDHIYRTSVGCGKIIDVDNVAAVIFHSSVTEQDYEVPIR